MKALVLNCTLKKSPGPSNTAMLAGEVVSGLQERGVEYETLRLVDMNISPGVSSDEGTATSGWDLPDKEEVLVRVQASHF